MVCEVRGRGLLRGVELIRDTATNAPYPELDAALKRTSLANGLILRVDPSRFALAPALIAEKKDIDEILSLVEKSLAEALKELGR